MTDPHIDAYAQAIVAIATTEGHLSETEDELFRFARALESSDELRETIRNPQIPVQIRQQIVEDLLGGSATSSTVSAVSMLVAADRSADIQKIADAVVASSASGRGQAVAEVRSAVALSDAQITALGEALKAKTNQEVSIRNIVDPNVVGGIVTQIGDTLLDGSVRTHLNQLRDAF